MSFLDHFPENILERTKNKTVYLMKIEMLT